MHTTVPGDEDRFAGCCPVPAPPRGAPHVIVWTASGSAMPFLRVKLGPEEAIRLGNALMQAGREVAPKKLEHQIGQLPLGNEQEDEEE